MSQSITRQLLGQKARVERWIESASDPRTIELLARSLETIERALSHEVAIVAADAELDSLPFLEFDIDAALDGRDAR